MSKLPSFQFYPGDWMKDPALRAVSIGARGLWIDMLCLMFESDRRGYLAHKNGNLVSPIQLARMTGCTAEEVATYLKELEDSGVFSSTEHGIIYSRRMIRDERKRQLCSEAGKKGGGNPTFKGDPKGPPKGDSKGVPKQNTNSSTSTSTSTSSSSSELNSQELINSENKNIPFLDNPHCRVAKKSQPRRDFSKEIGEIFAYWQAIRNHPKTILDKKRKKAIRARLEEGHSTERIKAAIRGISFSAFHMGKNDNQTVYDDIELICREGSQVDKFADLEEKSHGTFESNPWKSNKIRKILKFGTENSSLGRGFFEGDGDPQYALREPGPR